jgi:thymidine phosphorylase
MVIPIKVGDKLDEGDQIGVIHANDPFKLDLAKVELSKAISWSDQPTEPLPHFYDTVT